MRDNPKYYFSSSGERCDHMSVRHTINTLYIVYTIYEYLEPVEAPNQGNIKVYRSGQYTYRNIDGVPWKPTKKNIDKALRETLGYYGRKAYDTIDDYGQDIHGEEIDQDKWKYATDVAKRIFPKWFINYNNKSLRFITED